MRRLTATESSIAKFVLILVAALLITSLAAAEYVSYHQRQSMSEAVKSSPPPPPPPGTAELAITKEGVNLSWPADSEWRTVAQILSLLLGLYGGIRVINRFTEPPPRTLNK